MGKASTPRRRALSKSNCVIADQCMPDLQNCQVGARLLAVGGGSAYALGSCSRGSGRLLEPRPLGEESCVRVDSSHVCKAAGAGRRWRTPGCLLTFGTSCSAN